MHTTTSAFADGREAGRLFANTEAACPFALDEAALHETWWDGYWIGRIEALSTGGNNGSGSPNERSAFRFGPPAPEPA